MTHIDPVLAPLGLQVTEEQIKAAVAEEVEANKEKLLAERWVCMKYVLGRGAAAGRLRELVGGSGGPKRLYAGLADSCGLVRISRRLVLRGKAWGRGWGGLGNGRGKAHSGRPGALEGFEGNDSGLVGPLTLKGGS